MKKKQKGFTLVELLVVIAILAILATISVVGYLSFTNKAKESNDKGIITQANNVLLSNEALGNKPNTMFDVIEQINNEGLNLEKLSPNSDGCHFVWDEEANRIYILKNDQIVFPENVSQPNKLLLWKIVDTYNEQEQYSQYIKKTNNTIVINNLDTGLDLGLNDGISEITYNRNEQSSKQKVKIRTNSTNAKVNINTANDSVEHYGLAGVINIEEVAEKSYHEFGQTAFMDVKKGRVVLEKESNIHQLNITKNQAGNGYDKVILANNGANNLPDKITRDDVVITDANGQTVVSIVDIKTNVEEIVKAYPTSNNSNSTLKNDIQNSNVVSPLGNLVLDKTDGENSITTETKTQEVETAIDKVLNDKFLTETNFVVRMGTKGFSTFDALVEEISNVDGKIVLLKDISFDSIKGIYDNVITINKNITIDLNGHNFVYSPVSDGSYWGPTRTLFFVNRTGTLKIIDSQKVKGTFRIEPTLKCNITFAENYGSMTLDGVNLDLVSDDTKGYYVKGVENKDGQTLSVLNSKLISKNLNGSLIKSYGNLIISNSELKISGRNDAVNIQNPGTATILQSTINIIDGVSATSGVNTYGNDVTIKDTTFNLDGAGYCVNASNGNVMLENITINMISDKLKASEAYGINLLKDVKVTVLGNSSITIQYPNFGATGINVLGGNMLLKDNLVVTDKNNNAYGLRVLSMALADFKNKPTVQIDSGIFNSDVNIQSEARVVINGGTFNGAFDTFKPTISIYNGTFKVDPNNSIAKVSDLTQKDGLFVVTLNLNKVVAYIDNVPYESLGSAINAVSNGQTIRLVKESSEQITISKNLDFYLDLNNNQFTGKINVPTDYNLQLDGNHYIIKAPAEAIVNGVEYQTVGDAIKAIESNKIAQGSIIELKRDTDTYSITINNSVKFKIDNKSFKINISITNGDTWSKSVYIDSTYNTTIWNGNSYSLNNCGGKIIEIK